MPVKYGKISSQCNVEVRDNYCLTTSLVVLIGQDVRPDKKFIGINHLMRIKSVYLSEFWQIDPTCLHFTRSGKPMTLALSVKVTSYSLEKEIRSRIIVKISANKESQKSWVSRHVKRCCLCSRNSRIIHSFLGLVQPLIYSLIHYLLTHTKKRQPQDG